MRASTTLKRVVGALLSVGNVLNGQKVEAFELDYLSRVNTVKDTQHKTPLLVHLVELVTEQFPDSTDLHSEMNRVHRVAKVREREREREREERSEGILYEEVHV